MAFIAALVYESTRARWLDETSFASPEALILFRWESTALKAVARYTPDTRRPEPLDSKKI